jgi:DNA modification methylase
MGATVQPSRRIKFYKTEIVAIDKIRPNDWNPNSMDARMFAVLIKNIETEGFIEPVIITKDSVIVNGEHRWRALQQMGEKAISVVRLDLKSTDPRAKLESLALNEIHGDFIEEKLAAVLADLETTEVDLDLSGFDENALEKLLKMSNASPIEDEEEIPTIDRAMIVTKPGEVIILGTHRLVCGDSTKREAVDLLMNGKQSRMVFTEPPYNVDLGVSLPKARMSKRTQGLLRDKREGKRQAVIQGDHQSPSDWRAFCARIFEILRGVNTGDIYVWGASGPDGMVLRQQAVDAGYHWSATIVWVKDRLILSPANYHRQYEPCFYGWLKQSSFNFSLSSKSDARTQSDIWECPKPQRSESHPTMKPVALCRRGIENSSRRGDIVLDLFGGSGSTLIACEEAKRTCYMMEIDPAYCDVIVKRWEALTGKKADRKRKA